MAVRMKMFTLIFCFLIMGICGECLINMSSNTKSVVLASDALHSFHTFGMFHLRSFAHHRRS